MDNSGLADLYRMLVDFRDRRDWRRFHTPKDLAMSVSIESAELLELFQWKTDADVLSARDDPDFIASVEGEIADVLIYLTLLAGELDIDPLAAAISKTDQNERRFPEE